MQKLIDLLRDAPDSELDPTIVELIKGWDSPPKALDVLRVLDEAVFTGGASQLSMLALEEVLRQSMVAEGCTYKELTNKAMLREDMN